MGHRFAREPLAHPRVELSVVGHQCAAIALEHVALAKDLKQADLNINDHQSFGHELPFEPLQPIAQWCKNGEVPVELLIAVATFGFVTAITPGPNNTYLLASGANHGTRKSLVFVNGIMLGLGSMLVAIGLGLGAVFLAVPLIYEILKYIGFGYIVYLAYKVIRSGYKTGPDQVEEPRFFKSFLLQFVNPKAWIVCTSFMATYAPVEMGVTAVAICIAIFLITTYPGAVAWAIMGQGISKILTNPTRLRVFNWTAGILLVLTMVPALFI